MKIQVVRDKLNKALQTVSRVATNRGPLPILGNVLISASDSQIRISATNLEIAMIVTIHGKIETPGSLTVPARLLGEFISNLPEGPVSLHGETTALEVVSGHYSSSIQGMAPDEFPSLPDVEDASPINLKAGVLREALSQVVIATSSDESRPVFTGVLLNATSDSLVFTATDSYRLAEKTIKIKTKKEDEKVIIPAKAVQEIIRILSDDNEDVELFLDDSQIKLKTQTVSLVSRLIDGQFPSYQQLIPESSDTSIEVSSEEFARITKIASLFAREAAGSITLQADEEKQQLAIHSVASQVGENNSVAEGKIEGEGSVSLNSRYIIDALNVMDGETSFFRFSGKLSPCVLTSKGQDDYVHVIMPLRS